MSPTAASDRPNKKDGRWWPGEPGQTVAKIHVYQNITSKVVHRARIFRFIEETGKWEQESCPHNHYKRSAAKQCGEQAARRWNRTTKSENPS